MKTQYTATDKFLPCWIAAALAWEGYQIATNGETISACVWKWQKRYAAVAFALGYLAAHFTWQQYIAPAQVQAAVKETAKECNNS